MKYVALSQPGATLVAMGIRNAFRSMSGFVRRLGGSLSMPQSPLVNNAEYPLEWMQEAFNQELFGNLPPIEELPVNSLIGFFDYYSHTSSVDKESIWVAGLDESACIVCNAHMFDHPIRLPKEIIDNINDVDEMVPSHVCSPKNPFLLGMNDELVIDVSDKYFAIAARGGSFSLEYSVELSNLLQEKLDDIKVITLRNGIKNKGFIFKYDLIYDYVDGSNEVYKMYPSVLTPDHKMFRAQLMLSFDEPLIE